LISILLFFTTGLSCNRCRKPEPSPKDIHFLFSVIDEDGNDLFFGESAIYDPYSVKLFVEQVEETKYYLHVREGEKCFLLGGFYPVQNPYVFHIEFISNKTDTIKIKSRFGKSDCPPLPFFNDVFFNDMLICTNCNELEIYKIELK
jgi:hypothetical protein